MRSSLIYQMGQEIIYLLMGVSVAISFALAIYLIHLQKKNEGLEQQVAGLEKALEEAGGNAMKHIRKEGYAIPNTDELPIIQLDEATEQYKFESGKAGLSDDFKAQFEAEYLTQLISAARKAKADMIEVVGHTDGSTMRSHYLVYEGGKKKWVRRNSNLDADLVDYMQGRLPEGAELNAIDNAGLGMARAAAVVRYLKSLPALQQYEIVPLSAAQTIDTNHNLAFSKGRDNRKLRRVEIRVRRKPPN